MRRRLDLRAASAVLADGEPTMAEVAAALGVAKPTLYKLAKSRDDLVRTCVETEAERLLGHLHGRVGPGAGVEDVQAAIAAFAADSPGGFALLLEGRRGDERRRLETRLAELVGCSGVEAATLLGGAAAAISHARVNGA